MLRHIQIWLLLFCIAPLHVAPMAFAQAPASAADKLIDIGAGRVLEIVPAEYGTFLAENPSPQEEAEWVIIPPVYETVTETIIVHSAWQDVAIIPPAYKADGSISTPARAELTDIPAVTRDVTRRVVKTPSKVVKRIIPDLYHPPTVRKMIKPKSFIIRDKAGKKLHEFESPAALADYLNAD